ncbi:MAG: YbjQ family protein [Deltaproteobacteria bacterium]|nr:YbjQ family protein [Deltaproteobacteria bacterium]
MSRELIRSRTGAVTGFKSQVLLTTTDEVAGRKVREVKGLVRGNSIRARHVGHDLVAVFRNLVGGEIREYTKLMGESREQALDRLMEQASLLGANAVVGVRFTTSMVMNGAAELLAYGTAVVLEDA